ncbi:MAG TPA: AraC family transcriptional regulator [Chthoniobacterales bacterium]
MLPELPQLQNLEYGQRVPLFPGRIIPLYAMLGAVGYSRETSSDYDWTGLQRGRIEFAAFQYTLAGEGRLRVGTKEWALKPGDAMAVHFPDDNRYWLPAKSHEWKFIFVSLHGREVMRFWKFIEKGLGPRFPLPPDAPAIRCAARIVKAGLENTIPNAFVASSLAYELIAHLAAEVRRPVSAEAALPALKRAQKLAEQNLASPPTVDALAEAAGLSRFHFSRLFTQQFGTSPAAWVLDLRLKEAARLLRSTSLPLKEIASQCGFPDVNYLGKAFRTRVGLPPAAYRRSGF